jgi:hypothetical protein
MYKKVDLNLKDGISPSGACGDSLKTEAIYITHSLFPYSVGVHDTSPPTYVSIVTANIVSFI